MAQQHDSGVDHDRDWLIESLGPLPDAWPRPALVVVSGLPGTGKSYFCHRLTARVPMAVLESDVLRRVLHPSPTHAPAESARLFRAVHAALDVLLSDRCAVVVDATNLVRRNRARLYRIAEKHGSRLVVLRMDAPDTVIRDRLSRRMAGHGDTNDTSTAGIEVYERMRRRVDPIRRPHEVIDTSGDIAPALSRVENQLRRWKEDSGA